MKHNFTLKSQAGFLTLITVVLIVIVGFIAVTLAYITYGSSFANTNFQSSTAALYLAESGLEDGTHELYNPTLANRSPCQGLSLTNTLGNGTYTVTSTGPFFAAATTLSGQLNSSATTIPVVSAASYQSAGRIMIDKEVINYASKDATNFLGVTRGVDGSVAASHTSGTRIGQYQCNLSSQGGVPNLSPPSNIGGKRTITESIQLEAGIIVGNAAYYTWNNPTEKQVVQIAGIANLKATALVSYADAWIVGDNATALRFNGSTWTNTNSGITGSHDLTSVSAISAAEAWTVASQGRVYRWNGTTWSSTTISGTPTLNGISMVDSNNNGTADVGWLVGTTRTAYLYNGSTWTSTNTGIANITLNAVCTLSATEAWIAGNSGSVYRWLGGPSWSLIATPSSSPVLNSISMIKSDGLTIGWAVGNNSTAWFYNGSSWAATNAGLAANLTINGVVTVSSNEAWLVTSSGRVYEWNGSTWTLEATPGSNLSGIDMIHANNQPFSAWASLFG